MIAIISFNDFLGHLDDALGGDVVQRLGGVVQGDRLGTEGQLVGARGARDAGQQRIE